MQNPWLNCDFDKTLFHPLDKELIYQFNLNAKEENLYRDDLLPVPYIGNLDAKVMFLVLNPGVSPEDLVVNRSDRYIELHKKNISQEKMDFPFYYLNPKLPCPGQTWWLQKLKCLINEFGLEVISSSISCLQFVPYHSRTFKQSSTFLPTQKYTAFLLKRHIQKGLPLVVMRSRTLWTSLVPELEGYKNAFYLRNPRNPTVSPKNMGEERFKELSRYIG